MALLDEVGCDPTCDELMLHTPEAADGEFRALISKWRQQRAYVFRSAGKIFAVTNKEQGFGEFVTIIEPTPRPEEPARTAAPSARPIARRVRTPRPPRAPYGSPGLRSKRPPVIGGDGNGNGSLRRSGLLRRV